MPGRIGTKNGTHGPARFVELLVRGRRRPGVRTAAPGAAPREELIKSGAVRRAAIVFLLLTLTVPALALDPASYDVSIQAGEDYRLTLVMKNMSGHPMNLTGYRYKAQGRTTADAAQPFVNLSSNVTDPANGKVVVSLSKAQTTRNAGKAGYWDLQQTDPGGLVSYLIKGVLKIVATVTR